MAVAAKKLVIVESPAKAKTIEKFRGFEPPGSRGSGQSEWGKLCRKIPSLNKVVQFEPEHRGLIKVFKRVEWALDRYRHGGINQRFQQQVGVDLVGSAVVVHRHAGGGRDTVAEEAQLGAAERVRPNSHLEAFT